MFRVSFFTKQVEIMRILLVMFLTFLLCNPVYASPFMSPEAVSSAKLFHKNIIADGLDHPWGMVWLPDGSMLVTQREGAVRHLNADGSIRTREVTGVPEVLSSGQGGLLDISLHPDFSENGFVYFTAATGTRLSNRTTLMRARLDGKRFVDVKELFRVSQNKVGSQHFGSRLVWLPDGTFLMSIGDGGNPPVMVGGTLSRNLAQDGKSHLGKVLRFDAEGRPVEGAFPADAALPEVYSMGHRNIQGLVYDSIRKMIWASEHGALGGDELNRIQPGGNYGWPKVTFSKEYLGSLEISPYTTLPGKIDPELVWMNGIAPSGLALYTGDLFPDWKGDLFAGGLRDQSVRRIILNDAGRVQGEEIIRIGQRVRDVRQGPDGYLYVLTDESDGKLIRISPSKETDPNP